MTEAFLGFGTALWLGILTAVSPCPLATNIAAVSFLAKKMARPSAVFIAGLAYTIGRMVAYAVLGWIIVNSLLSVPQAAGFLQKYAPRVLGPVLIVTGFILLEVIAFRLPGIQLSQKNQNRLAGSGAPGAFLLGLIFALAFCPVSAALFFGSLIPLALNAGASGVLLPFVYGIGTGLPVLLFSVAIAQGAASLGRWFHRAAKIEQYARRATGVIFIIVGLYYTGIYILKLF